MTVYDIAMAVGATLRLSRVVTTDDAGMLVRIPAERWAKDSVNRQHVVGGLECPFCVGFWIGLGVLTTYAAVRKNPAALTGWRVAAGSLAMNYVVGHASSRLD